jgi:hypothetical protein
MSKHICIFSSAHVHYSIVANGEPNAGVKSHVRPESVNPLAVLLVSHPVETVICDFQYSFFRPVFDELEMF